jgi:hypothetical protein
MNMAKVMEEVKRRGEHSGRFITQLAGVSGQINKKDLDP